MHDIVSYQYYRSICMHDLVSYHYYRSVMDLTTYIFIERWKDERKKGEVEKKQNKFGLFGELNDG